MRSDVTKCETKYVGCVHEVRGSTVANLGIGTASKEYEDDEDEDDKNDEYARLRRRDGTKCDETGTTLNAKEQLSSIAETQIGPDTKRGELFLFFLVELHGVLYY